MKSVASRAVHAGAETGGRVPLAPPISTAAVHVVPIDFSSGLSRARSRMAACAWLKAATRASTGSGEGWASHVRRTTSTASELATCPPKWPPMPSATTIKRPFLSYSSSSSGSA